MVAFPAEGNCLDQQNRKKPFPESAVRVIAWNGPVRATAKAVAAKAGLNDIKCCNSKDALLSAAFCHEDKGIPHSQPLPI